MSRNAAGLSVTTQAIPPLNFSVGGVKSFDALRDIPWGSLRHAFAREIPRTGSDTITAQDILRRSDIRTTEIYAHIIRDKIAGTTGPFHRLCVRVNATIKELLR